MNNPLVSIICTNYNKGSWIQDALESFLSQNTSFGVEILVIDDCSTDGSTDIIKDYEQKYPEKIKALYNEENLGITKTWKKVCPEARGKFVARCDGDDYWIDNDKLQKQVDFLAKHPSYKWCSTDFNLVDTEGNLISEKVFQNNIVPLADTFEKMLATRGFTMSSTWLVERDLMLAATEKISEDASDDTFELQLEFYQETKLLFLSEVTTVYRENLNSDSKPMSEDKMFARIDGLLKTQLNYLEKYSNQDKREIVRILMNRDSDQEKRIHQLTTQNYHLNEKVAELIKENQKAHSLLSQELNSSIRAHKEADRWKSESEYWENEYQKVIFSKRWKLISQIIRFFRRK